MKRITFMFGVLAMAAAFVPAAPALAADDEDWQSLFDGKTLKGWDGKKEFWSVQDGAITGETTADNPTKGNTFIIYRGSEFGDFELKLKYRIGKTGNSGVQYRSWETAPNSYVIGGYQADIDSGPTYSGINYGERFRGILAGRGQRTVIEDNGKPKLIEQFADGGKLNDKVKKEQWNDYHIIAKGYNFKHYINGTLMSEVTDEDKDQRRDKGVLALQLHAGPPMKVQFKDVVIKAAGKEGADAGAIDTKGLSLIGVAKKKKVVFIAGHASHGFGGHDHKAGCHLFAKMLEASGLGIECVVHYPGWPEDASIFDGASAVVIYSNGGGGHPAIRNSENAETLDALAKKGVGVGCIHYAVEVPKGTSGDYMLNWTGGYFETHWSVNPHWTLQDTQLAKNHPITRGVKPYQLNDEWYYHMRFRPNMQRVTPILTAMPPEETLKRGDGAHSNNPAVRKAVLEDKQPQHLMWAIQRDESYGNGRGFGFTGGHVHWNWVNDNHRTLVLNAIAWIAQVEVPKSGVPSKTPTVDEMLENHDDAPQNINKDDIARKLEQLAGE